MDLLLQPKNITIQSYIHIELYITSLVVVILEIIIYNKILMNENSFRAAVKPQIIYLLIFVLSQIFQLVIAIDTVAFKNSFQLVTLFLFNFCTFAYSIVQYYQIKDVVQIKLDYLKSYIIAIAVVIAICQAVYLYLTYKLIREFGWNIYRKIGADIQLRRYYLCYHIFIMLLKFDFFYLISFSLQFLMLILNTNDVEYAFTIVALPLTAIIMAIAIRGIRKENKTFMIISLLGLVAGLAYFLFKIYRIYGVTTRAKYVEFRIFLTIFAVLAVFHLLISLIVGIVCFFNFDKGLLVYTDPNPKFKVNRLESGVNLSDQ